MIARKCVKRIITYDSFICRYSWLEKAWHSWNSSAAEGLYDSYIRHRINFAPFKVDEDDNP